jgi:hypothetical protein
MKTGIEIVREEKAKFKRKKNKSKKPLDDGRNQKISWLKRVTPICPSLVIWYY